MHNQFRGQKAAKNFQDAMDEPNINNNGIFVRGLGIFDGRQKVTKFFEKKIL